MRERLDDARAQPGFYLSKDAVRPANPVVGDRKLPIRPCGIISDGYPAICPVARKPMLESIHHKLSDDQAEAPGLTGRRTSSVAADLKRDWPGIADHRGCEGVAQLCEIRPHVDRLAGPV